VEKPEGKRPIGRPRCKWKIILRWLSNEYGGVMWTVLRGLGLGMNGELL
jgi:hypothetical protein